ncbi:MAG: FAD-binding protein [Anaerolineales bacterium]|nr:FAD-binding protein [Anaerolineales bacterium]
MRRWNGWGDEATEYPLHETASRHLSGRLGPGPQIQDATIEEVISTMHQSRLWDNPWITTSSEARLRHARGQSLPDWIALRSGQIDTYPDGVAFPASDQEVRDILEFALEEDVRLIPYGGGTSVLGHINPLMSEKPSLTLDLSRLNQLLDLDETSLLTTFGAGVRGPDLESQLNRHGYTLGHYPQSFELSTLGGWIATRSTGQQSIHYGRIEDLFAGGHVETPMGSLELPCYPASAAGPDLRHIILGSEGRLGVITRATVRIRRIPESEQFYGVFFKDWESGFEAVRKTAQAEVPISMMRLSDPQETETTLLLSGRDMTVNVAQQGLNLLGYGDDRCLLIFGVTGDKSSASRIRGLATSIFRSFGGLPAISTIGDLWRQSRFLSPYLRNTLWELGYAVDTLETAAPWSTVKTLHIEIGNAMEQAFARIGEAIVILSHISHVYIDGASLYITFIFRRAHEPIETLNRWKLLKGAASEMIIERGGTISHQHGIGLDHAVYLPYEKGPLGIGLINAVSQELDPHGLMNPGKLLEARE